MKSIWKIIIAIGGTIAGILAIFASSKTNQSKKEFNNRVKANNDKLDFITGQAAGVEKKKKATKAKIKKTSTKILNYRLQQVKLLNEQIKLYDDRLNQVDKWYKKPWVGVVGGVVGTIITIHVIDYSLPK